MENIKKIAEFIKTNRASIATIAAASLVFLLGRGLIQQDTAQLIGAILAALGIGADIRAYAQAKATAKAAGANK